MPDARDLFALIGLMASAMIAITLINYAIDRVWK